MTTTGAMCDYLEDALINHVLRNIALTSPTTVYVALFTVDPTDAGTMTNEVTNVGSAYVRQSVAFGAPGGGITSNSGTVTFPTATADWGTVGWFLITDLVTYKAGNALLHCQLDIAKPINIGDTARFNAGDLSVTFD